MKLLTDLTSLPARPRALAIGTFDGVHAGHRAVIRRALDLAVERGLTSAVVTFDRHPMTVIDAARVPRLLTPLREKIRLIEELGPDELIVLTFDERLAALTSDDFCAGLLAGTLQARVVVVGENFSFGAGGSGDATQLRTCGAAHGFETIALRAGHRARQDDQLHAHPSPAARRRAGGGAGGARPAAFGGRPRGARA